MQNPNELLSDIHSLLSTQLDDEVLSQPLRIQMGREVVFKGVLGQEPELDKLTPMKVALLQATLSCTTQSNSPSQVNKGTVNIDLGETRLFRYGAKGIETDICQLADLVKPQLDEARTDDRVSASVIVAMEIEEVAQPAEKEWFADRFAKVYDSAIGIELRTQGAAATRAALSQVAQLPQATKNRALTDSVVALTKELGGLQDTGQGKQFVYQAESYSVRVKGTNHYILSDDKGKDVLSFRHHPVKGATITRNELSASQQFDLIRAGSELTAIKAGRMAQGALEVGQTLVSRMGNLAPKGLKDKVLEGQHQQVAQIATALINSAGAIATDGGKMFQGKAYQIFQSSGVTRMFSRQGKQEVFRQDADGVIESRLSPANLKGITQMAQSVVKAVQSHGSKVQDVSR